MRSYKILVTGPFNAGKTAFIRTASDIDIVTTERKITDPSLEGVKEETTVAMDYGQTRLEKVLLHLYGTPGQARFDFMWDILSREMDAFILVIDSQDRSSLMEAKQILRLFRKKSKVPFVIVANKQDAERRLSNDEIARALGITEETPLLPCVALDKQSVREVLSQVAQKLG